MNKKYKLGEKHKYLNLYKIIALRDFGDVKEGDVGGWIEGEHNLSHEGDCWVYDGAVAHENAKVFGAVKVRKGLIEYTGELFQYLWTYCEMSKQFSTISDMETKNDENIIYYKPIIIAGPCMAESFEVMDAVATALTEGTKDLDIDLYFKASFDKANRKDLNSPRGPGLEKGIKYLKQISERYNIKTLTDIHNPLQASLTSPHVDAIQVPAGLSRITDILVASGEAASYNNIKVNIKRGTNLSPKYMVEAAAKTGLPKDKVWLCERGSAYGHDDLIVDMRGLKIMHDSGHPVIFDCTHSTNKQSEYAPLLARAAAATGYIHGVFMEVHPNPKSALCDGPCMLTPEQAVKLIHEIVDIINKFKQE